jgi:diguanylate cyclase (GGDEF)-like protein/PAS domain S-box-containing protein
VLAEAGAWSGARTLTTVYRIRKRDGAMCWIQDSRRMAADDGSQRDVVVGSWQDVTALRLAQESLREQEALFRAVVQNTHDVITLMKDDGSVLYQSPSARKVMGRDPAASVGRNAFRFMHPEDASRLQAAIADLACNPDGAVTLEVRAPHADGSLRTFETVVKLLPKEFGPNIALTTARDVTERKVAEERRGRHEATLAHQACHDPLTGLANRKLFMERLTDAIEKNKQEGAPFAVVYMDVDRFKQINDALGHVDADHVLKAFVARVQVHLRKGDLFARLGGDEFGAVVRGFENRADIVAIAQRIKDAGLLPLALPSGKTVSCTASIGIVFGDEGVDSIPEIIKCADAAMYCAKSRGRAQFEVFAARMFEERACRMELRNELPNALEKGGLHLEYQPCVDLTTGALTRCEALLRWRFGDVGLVPPDRVVEIARESGLIDRVALWCIEEVCGQIQRWDSAGVAVPRVAINLSAHNLAASTVVERIPVILAEHGVSANRLEIEISEQALFDLGPEARRRLLGLRGLGLSIAVDNFGRGHSSLNHLRDLPAQTVKIDRTVVADLPVEPRSAAVVRAIAVMGEALGVRVVGEGVETDQQLAILRREGCQEAQGFLISRPCLPEQLGPLLEKWRSRKPVETA